MPTPNTPSFHDALYTNAAGQTLEQQITAAYERNVAAGRVRPPTTNARRTLGSVVTAELAADAAAEAAANLTGLEGLSIDFRELVTTTHQRTTDLFEDHLNTHATPTNHGIKHNTNHDVIPPSLETIAKAGVNWQQLEQTYNQMTQDGLQPELIIVPSLNPEQWKTLYRSLLDDPVINHDGRIRNNGLYVDPDVASHWQELDDPTQNRGTIIQVESNNADSSPNTNNTTDWQVLLIPATPKPTQTNVDHNHNQQDHPSLSAYLTLQAQRLLQQANDLSQTPIDSKTYAWLQGSYKVAGSERPHAPYGYWDADDGRVGVSWGGVSYSVASLGSRGAAWG